MEFLKGKKEKKIYNLKDQKKKKKLKKSIVRSPSYWLRPWNRTTRIPR